MCQLIDFPDPGISYARNLADTLDLAQSQLDEAEQLFAAGHDEAAHRCITTAMQALGGIQ